MRSRRPPVSQNKRSNILVALDGCPTFLIGRTSCFPTTVVLPFQKQHNEGMNIESITLATQTMFAELQQRCLDAEFDELYDERGTFRRKLSKGRMYWHHQRKIAGKVVNIYVGPVTDKSITDRVKRFAEIKSDFKGRQEMVRALAATGLPTPDATSGAVVEAMWKAGFFRLRGVLVGTVAFQAYAGPLGIRLPGRCENARHRFRAILGDFGKHRREYAAGAAGPAKGR